MATIPFVPALLPGEIIYSFLARTLALNALGPPRSGLQVLFGTSNVIPSIDLPTRIEILQERLGRFSPFRSVDDLIERATLYPYYRPFLPAERHKQACQIIRQGGARGLKTLLGLVASRFGASAALRFCPKCSQEHLAHFGVTYWHKHLQLPAVTVCPVHRTTLIEGPQQNRWSHRQRLEMLPGPGNSQSVIPCGDPHLFLLAALSRELVDAHLPPLSPERRRDAYIEAIQSRGYTRMNGRPDWVALAADFGDHFANFATFPHRERLISSGDVPVRWLEPLILRTDRVCHPILHLLLIGFLFSSVASFRAAADQVSAKGSMKPMARTAPNTETCRDESILHNTHRSCRQVAIAIGVSTTTVATQRRALGIPVSERRKTLTYDLISAVEHDLGNGVSVTQAARKWRISVASTYRIRRGAPNLAKKLLERKQMAERFKRRGIWRKCLRRFRDQGIKSARIAAPATYAWLYRNDRDWLRSVQPHNHRSQKNHAPRIDWPKRDRLLAQSAKTLVTAIKNAPTRPRITSTRILRALGCQAMMRMNGPRLPELQLTLKSLGESVVDFQRHRIRNAIGSIRDRHLDPTLWRIQREARLKKWTPTLRSFALETILEDGGKHDVDSVSAKSLSG